MLDELPPEYIDKEGIRRQKIPMALSEQIINSKSYPEFRGKKTWTGDYKAELVDVLSNDLTHSAILVWCGVKGEPTRIMDKTIHLLTIIDNQERIIQTLKAGNAGLIEDLEDARGIQSKLAKKLKETAKQFDFRKEEKDTATTTKEDESQ